jgi:hypothetical protein
MPGTPTDTVDRSSPLMKRLSQLNRQQGSQRMTDSGNVGATKGEKTEIPVNQQSPGQFKDGGTAFEFPTDPKMSDFFNAMNRDWAQSSMLEAENFNKDIGAANQFSDNVAALSDDAKARNDAMAGRVSEYIESVDSANRLGNQAAAASGRQNLEDAKNELTAGKQEAFGIIGGGLDTLRGLRGDVRAIADEAINSFRDTSAAQANDFLAGHRESTRTQKTQMAAQLRQQGLSESQIQREMQKVDFQSSQTQARQMSQFSIENETARRDLRKSYDQMTVETDRLAANLGTQLTSQAAAISTDTASKRAALDEARVQVDQWEAAANQQSRLSAVSFKSQVELSTAQLNSASDMLDMQGYSEFASMIRDTDMSMTPYAPVLSSIIGSVMMLEDRNMERETNATALFMTATGALSASLNNAADALTGARDG